LVQEKFKKKKIDFDFDKLYEDIKKAGDKYIDSDVPN